MPSVPSIQVARGRASLPQGLRVMRRHSVLLVVVLLCAASPAWAQVAKIFKIGILTDAMVPWHSTSEGFRDGLKELGYVDGENVIFEARASQRWRPSWCNRNRT